MKAFDILSGRSEDFKQVFLGTEAGQRVLAHLYEMCNMNRQIHTPGDPHTTSFNAGAHRVGQGIQSILGQDEQEINKILKLKGSGALETEISDYDPYNK